MNRHHHSATTARFAVALVLSGPILWAAWASHQPIDRIFANGSPGSGTDAPSWQWSNYRDAVTRLPLLRFVANSVVITTAATLGTVLSTSLAGFAFARLRWRGRRLWHVVLLATMMLPGQVLLIGQFFVFSRLGWVNTYKPLIVPAWLAASSLAVLVFREFFAPYRGPTSMRPGSMARRTGRFIGRSCFRCPGPSWPRSPP
jgi:ABC-type glycerol-3-phosphate transport system permease component